MVVFGCTYWQIKITSIFFPDKDSRGDLMHEVSVENPTYGEFYWLDFKGI